MGQPIFYLSYVSNAKLPQLFAFFFSPSRLSSSFSFIDLHYFAPFLKSTYFEENLSLVFAITKTKDSLIYPIDFRPQLVRLSCRMTLKYIAILLFSLSGNANAFQPPSRDRIDTSLPAVDRRKLIIGTVTTVAASLTSESAEATYSAFSRREQDWQERSASGEIQYTSAKQLRQQLREIVPQNSESSRIFCPNGPSANVSPLMENKCGDRMAAPSVYGRSDDVLGNSIPGFGAGRGVEGSGSLSSEVGGFPAYKK
jgi:hypothetical protein